jgi:hypothetical protein
MAPAGDPKVAKSRRTLQGSDIARDFHDGGGDREMHLDAIFVSTADAALHVTIHSPGRHRRILGRVREAR